MGIIKDVCDKPFPLKQTQSNLIALSSYFSYCGKLFHKQKGMKGYYVYCDAMNIMTLESHMKTPVRRIQGICRKPVYCRVTPM